MGIDQGIIEDSEKMGTEGNISWFVDGIGAPGKSKRGMSECCLTCLIDQIIINAFHQETLTQQVPLD
jgi:hypothetical protein